jgi:hypothetical protein
MDVTFLRRNWSATGGAENYLRRLAGALQQRGHRTRLLCESWDPGDTQPFDEVAALPGSTRRTSAPRRFADQANLRLMEGNHGLVFSMERGIKADVYRAGDGIHAAWLHRRAQASPVRGRLRTWFNRKNRVVCDLERVTFHPANTRAVIANSEMVKREIQAFFYGFPPDRIHVLRNGVDAAFLPRATGPAGEPPWVSSRRKSSSSWLGPGRSARDTPKPGKSRNACGPSTRNSACISWIAHPRAPCRMSTPLPTFFFCPRCMIPSPM